MGRAAKRDNKMQNQQNHKPDANYTKWAGTALGLADLGLASTGKATWRATGNCKDVTELARRVTSRAAVAGFVADGSKISDTAGKVVYPMPVTKNMALVVDIKQLTRNTCILDIWVG